jgi:hypothetical protein
MSSTWTSHLLPHGPWRKLAPRLWEITGSLPRGKLPRNMVVHKLASGGLLIHSAVVIDEAALAEMLAWGEPEVMIVPSGLHRLDAAAYKERFPKLRVLAPAASKEVVEKKIKVDATCEDALPALGVKAHAADGIRPVELAYEMPIDAEDGKALVVTDMLMNIPHLPGFDGMIMRLLGSTGFFGITRIGKVLLMKDRAAFKAWLCKMATTTGLNAVCVAHGDLIVERCSDRLLEAADRL